MAFFKKLNEKSFVRKWVHAFAVGDGKSRVVITPQMMYDILVYVTHGKTEVDRSEAE